MHHNFLGLCHHLEGDDDPGMGEQLDPYEMLPAVNVLGKLPSDFEENIVCVRLSLILY